MARHSFSVFSLTSEELQAFMYNANIDKHRGLKLDILEEKE
jgi:hypothetical protein